MRNKQLLMNMAAVLEPFLDKIIFVGGCAVDYLITDPAAGDTRITEDVDVIAEIVSKKEFYELQEQLKILGFAEKMPLDEETIPLCRMEYNKMLLDIMPTEGSVLGFTNRWYLPALKSAKEIVLENGLTIRLISPAYFIATKLSAFRSRGKSDFYCHDMEDIINVINGNINIVTEILSSDEDVKNYIRSEFIEITKDRLFLTNCIPGHLDNEDIERTEIVYKKIQDVIS